MKRGLKRRISSGTPSLLASGRREHPDEEGTETAIDNVGGRRRPRAAESTPMKRGLKRSG